MKQKIRISDGNTVVFQGRIADMPIQEKAIIQKSVELFDDDDPCIIHQSYVIKEYVDVVLQLLKKESPLHVQNHLEELFFLALDNPQNCQITLEG